MLKVDYSLFGKTYQELQSVIPGMTALEAWEWAANPLDWCTADDTEGNGICLFFENNRLVWVRIEKQISDDAIPADLYSAAKELFGRNYDYYFYYTDTGAEFEYDWWDAEGSHIDYAMFLNPYDGVSHVCQQYMSPDYSGFDRSVHMNAR